MGLMSWKMVQAIKRGAPRLVFAKIEHPDGDGYFHNGIGQIEYDGHVWAGGGSFVAVGPINRTSDVSIQEVNFTVSGISQEIVAGLNSDVRDRAGMVWLVCLDDAGKVIPDPYLMVETLLDNQSFKVEDDGSATITITARSGFYTLERAVDEVWSSENARKDYPLETGFDLIPSLQNKDIRWTPNEPV